MSETKDTRGSAFPSEQHECQDNTWNQTFDPGMTLRDWFAGMVLGGQWDGRFPDDISPSTVQRVAEACYEIADAMLKERAKGAT